MYSVAILGNAAHEKPFSTPGGIQCHHLRKLQAPFEALQLGPLRVLWYSRLFAFLSFSRTLQSSSPFLSSLVFLVVMSLQSGRLLMYRLGMFILKDKSTSKSTGGNAIHPYPSFSNSPQDACIWIKKLSTHFDTALLSFSMKVRSSAAGLEEPCSWHTTSLGAHSSPDGCLS